jgi:hypothetical protein
VGFYSNRILPTLIDLSMRNRELRAYRERVIGAADGRVLEIGIGSGRNLLLYPARVSRVIGYRSVIATPGNGPRSRAGDGARHRSSRGQCRRDPAGKGQHRHGRIYLVAMQHSRCAARARRNAARPEAWGRFLFVEHGRAPDAGVRWWQDRLTPIWKRLGGGCHLNRAIVELIEGAGFNIERLETGYMRRRNPMTFMYEGSARPR